MSPSPSSAQPPMKQGLLTLLVIAVFVNYIDRGNLSVSAAVMGQLSSAFFWAYSLWQVPAGWLIQRNDVHRVFAIGNLKPADRLP